MRNCTYCGKPNEVTATQCLLCGTAFESQPQATVAKATRCCPHCGKAGDYQPAVALKKSWSLVAFLLGGFILMMVHSLSRRQKVQCNQCSGFFYVHTVRSRV